MHHGDARPPEDIHIEDKKNVEAHGGLLKNVPNFICCSMTIHLNESNF